MHQIFAETYEFLGIITDAVAYSLLAVSIVALIVVVARLVEGGSNDATYHE